MTGKELSFEKQCNEAAWKLIGGLNPDQCKILGMLLNSDDGMIALEDATTDKLHDLACGGDSEAMLILQGLYE